MNRPGLRLAFAAVHLAALLSAVPAQADGSPPAPLAQSLKGEAKADYDSALLLLDDGDNAGALAKFSHAYDISHDARLLWNMAVCEKERRHYSLSATLIDRYLKEGGKRISTQQRLNATDAQTALSAFYVTVKLSGAPDGATVFVDGIPIGETPLAKPLLVDLGSRMLRLEHSGFEPFETKLEVAGGGELQVPVALEPPPRPSIPPARLSISTSRSTDLVALDGKVLGSHRWQGVVSVGEHTVRVTGDGKKPYETHVQMVAGSTRSLQVTLEEELPRSTVWIWIAGGAAVAAGAVVGGYLLFKPQESPGTHPEGKLSTVYLTLGSEQR